MVCEINQEIRKKQKRNDGQNIFAVYGFVAFIDIFSDSVNEKYQSEYKQYARYDQSDESHIYKLLDIFPCYSHRINKKTDGAD